MLGDEAQEAGGQDAQRRLFAMADHQQIAAVLAEERRGSRVLDGHRRAQPSQRRRAVVGPGGGPRAASCKFGVVAQIGRNVALEDDRRRRAQCRLPASWPTRCEVVVALVVGEPDDLEGMVALEQAVGVVVDRLARPGQQPGGRVVFAQDQVGVGFAALQGDADRHLADRAAGQRVGPAQASASPAARGCRTPGPAAPAGPAAGPTSWAMRSSSTNNSWNSSIISRIRGQPGLGLRRCGSP